jgi:hypothetical protein
MFAQQSCTFCIPWCQHCHPPTPGTWPTLLKKSRISHWTNSCVSTKIAVYDLTLKPSCSHIKSQKLLLYKEFSYTVKASGLH